MAMAPNFNSTPKSFLNARLKPHINGQFNRRTSKFDSTKLMHHLNQPGMSETNETK